MGLQNSIALADKARVDKIIRQDAEDRLEFQRQQVLKAGICPSCTKEAIRKDGTFFRFPWTTAHFACDACGERHIVTATQRRIANRSLWG